MTTARKIQLAWSATEAVPSMLKVAFATSDRASANEHFGAASGFAVYAIDGEHARLVEVAEFSESAEPLTSARPAPMGEEAPQAGHDNNGRGGSGHSESRLATKIAALEGCAAVYCLAVGGSAARQLLARGIHPVRLDAAESIDALLVKLRAAIREGSVPWLTTAVHRARDSARFERMAAEGWEE
ncbi:NifB/NifX family molybdenum-iron cluster-binding protein [Rhodocyclus gracilis]